jgi:hypothetical protein
LILAYVAQQDYFQFLHLLTTVIISFSLWLHKFIYNDTYIYMSYFLYIFISCWLTWLITQCIYCEQSCSKHDCEAISLIYWFTPYWMYTQEWLDKIIK